ncbi:hypothetical protein KI387_027712 [Taxus chinensis]|uniref:Uncharacterized protein n=1 Tax=Taxus chinensis TaxID=29808 RepID=A0AA38FXP2_TAXCH|nr:hypothetical protein KI387_027712 [Taxus chinensis]
MEASASLPDPGQLSASVVDYLDHHFQTYDDFSQAPHLASSLEEECAQIDQNLHDIDSKITEGILKWASHSHQIRSLLQDLTQRIEANLRSEGMKSKTPNTNEKKLVEELPTLAREVARVEKVRIYAETALQLEALVGDLEDAVSSSMTGNSRKLLNSVDSKVAGPQENQLMAVKALKDIEDVLGGVVRSRPQWRCLVTAVDIRVDRAIAALRPLAIADHRALLTTLGWPPSLATTNLGSEDQGENSKMSNPLFEMCGNVKERYSESFLALSTLQSVQLRRKTRQLDQFEQGSDTLAIKMKGAKLKLGLHEALWTVEELVSPIMSRAEYHFSKWTKNPELIFTFGYRISQEFIDTVDNVLQPLMDKARLVGYSAREEWVSAIVSMISTYLAKQVFPDLVMSLVEQEASTQARISWLHLVDLIIAFDRRMQVLLVRSGVAPSHVEDAETLGVSPNILELRMTCMTVFCDRPDWLELWADIELSDAQEKLKDLLEKEKSWVINAKPDLFSGHNSHLTSKSAHGSFVFSTREDYKASLGAESVLSTTWALINRCRTLPDALLRFQFIRTAAAPILAGYQDLLLQRCQEAEALTALADDEAMLKVAISVNSARYCECILQEWCEDIFFLELQLARESEGRETGGDIMAGVDLVRNLENNSDLCGSVFDEEIENFKKFQTDWLAKLIAVILRGFDARCREYVRNKKQWQEKDVDQEVQEVQGGDMPEDIRKVDEIDNQLTNSEVFISAAFVDALDVLQAQLKNLKGALNELDFMELWRSLARGLDQFLFNSMLLSNARFSKHGVCQLKADVHALFQIFKPFCARPAGFFPNLSDSLRLLLMPPSDVNHLQNIVSSSSSAMKDDKDETKLKRLRQYGIRKISAGSAEKILRQRI